MKKLTYEQRIAWFINNHYETGMEYPILLYTMKDEDLNNVQWYDETVSIPEEVDEYTFNALELFCNRWKKEIKDFQESN